jgi:ABC-type nickel/cobalt efflux system permease component RcnA
MDAFDSGILALLLSAVALAASHALSPDHWFPFVVIGRANNWRTLSVLGLAFLAAAGHATTSIAVGLVSVFAEKGAPAEVIEVLREVTPALLIAFGAGYAVVSYYKLRVSSHGHSHGLSFVNKWLGIDPHDYEMHDDGLKSDACCAADHHHEKPHCDCPTLPGRHLSNRAAWGLVVILGITPCVALVPLTFAAHRHGMGAVVLVNAVFAVSAVIAILTATFFALKGLKLVRLGFFDRYGGVTAGLIIALIGVAGYLFGHSHHLH